MEYKSVYFRAFEPEDAALIYKWKNDHEMMKDAVGMARPVSMEECREWVAKCSKHDPFNYWFAICLNDGSNRMIGYTGVNNIHFVNSSATSDAVVIGEKEFRDGISWIETYLFILDFVFIKLNLNRFYGVHFESQNTTSLTEPLFFITKEGMGREAIYQNGKYTNLVYKSILRKEYMEHLANGDYTLKEILKRFKKVIKSEK